MKKILLLFVGVLLGISVGAQPAGMGPDLNQIKKNVADKKSPQYYPKLVKAFAKMDVNDTNSFLSIEDLQAFYYGRAYMENYNPYKNYDEEDEIRKLINQEEISKEDAQKVLTLANSIVDKEPSDPIGYFYQSVAMSFMQSRDSVAQENAVIKCRALFAAFANSGNALAPDSAVWVTNVAHEYMFMNMYGFSPKSQDLRMVDGHAYDCFALQENEYDIDTLWFNIDLIQSSWSKMFQEEKSAGNSSEKVTEVTIPYGSKFVLEMVKEKKTSSEFRVLSVEFIDDTLIADQGKLFPDPIPEGQIVGYFVPTRLYEGSEGIEGCLIFIGNTKSDILEMDTKIQYKPSSNFQTTSNSGIFKGVMHNEMWQDPLANIMISNIRKAKKR